MTAEARLAYLTHTVELLWPGGGENAPSVVLPSVRAPRLLVPVRPRRAAASAVLRYTAQLDRYGRTRGFALAAAVRAGLCSALPSVHSVHTHAESIDDHLADVLGHPVVTTLALTRDRSNRKPVLQVFDRRGRTVAFAKIGVSDLTRALVDAEADGLTQLGLARLSHIEIPRVLHHGSWRGCSVLVASALAASNPIRISAPELAGAMHEVSVSVSVPASGNIECYLEQLRARAEQVGEPAADWLTVFEALVSSRDLSGLPVGAWHGDWTTWNCGRRDGRVLVWDWERFTHPAPLGFDRLHLVLNTDVGPQHDKFRPAASALVRRSDVLLARWALGREDARSVALLYVMDIALRYLADDARRTDDGGRVEEWAFPTVREWLPAPKPEHR